MRLERKTRFFELGASAFEGIYPDAPRGYVCPICLRGFTERTGLTVEHVPPKSQGGRPLCLTCRECNSLGGHTVDAAMVAEARIKAALGQRDGRRRAMTLRADTIEVNVDVTRSSEGTHIDIPLARNNPKKLTGLQERMKRILDEEDRLNLTVREPFTRRAADVGYLRAAYLAAFAKLGYRFILDSALTPIRRQILMPASTSLLHLRIYERGQDANVRRLILVEKPLPCIAVQVGSSLVFLPRSGTECDHIQTWLRESNGDSRRTRIESIGTMTWPTAPEFRFDLRRQEE